MTDYPYARPERAVALDDLGLAWADFEYHEVCACCGPEPLTGPLNLEELVTLDEAAAYRAEVGPGVSGKYMREHVALVDAWTALPNPRAAAMALDPDFLDRVLGAAGRGVLYREPPAWLVEVTREVEAGCSWARLLRDADRLRSFR